MKTILSFLKRWWSGEIYREAVIRSRRRRAEAYLAECGLTWEDFSRMDQLQRARIIRDIARVN